MRVVVTGASGMIGSEVVRQLRAKGHDTLSLDIRPPADASVPHRVVDGRAPSALRAAFDGADAVCHLGEIPSVYGRSPMDVLSHNVEVGSSVIQIAATLGVPKLIYTSSCQVYGMWGAEVAQLVPPEKLPMDETAPLRPQNAYALSKVCNETFARMAVRQWNNIAIAAFRFPWVIPTRYQDQVIKRALSHPRQLPDDGMGSYLGQEDAASAYVCALEHGWTGFEAFHFVAEDVLSDEPIGPALARFFPGVRVPDDWPEFVSPVSTEKAKTMLNWRPNFNLRQKMDAARNQLAQAC